MHDKLNLVAEYKAKFSNPQTGTPSGCENVFGMTGTSIDTPILGNGYMTGTTFFYDKCIQIWINSNDFWRMKSTEGDMEPFCGGPGKPHPMGRLVIKADGIKCGKVSAEQDFLTATTCFEYGEALSGEMWICSDENVLVVNLKANKPLLIYMEFLFPDELDQWVKQCSIEKYSKPIERKWRDRGVLIASRTYENDVDQVTQLGAAAKFIEYDGRSLKMQPGDNHIIALELRSAEKAIRPVHAAQAAVRYLTKDDISMRRELHLSWWREYWMKSALKFSDETLMQRYYLSMYVLGSLSRDPFYPPSLFGVSTWDAPAWNGNYKINYNHQTPYLPLYAAGHFEQADPQDAPFISMYEYGLEQGEHSGSHGILLPAGLGPKGMISENMDFCMKSMGAMGVANMAMRYYMTLDKKYARRIYRYVKGIADYWENDLKWDGKRYYVEGDCAHEVQIDYHAINSSNSLGFIRATLKLVIKLSEALDVDADKRPKWNKILNKLSCYHICSAEKIGTVFGSNGQCVLHDLVPEEELENKNVFAMEEIGNQWSTICNAQLLEVYPANDIGLDSNPKILDAARNTLKLRSDIEDHSQEWSKFMPGWSKLPKSFIGRGGWKDVNQGCLFFPTAVHLGIDPKEILDRLHNYIAENGLPNGYIKMNPHGIETLSNVPNTIQEMMLLSHEGIIRVFKVWPRDSYPDAWFEDLRAYGGFVISASLENGVVADLKIKSNAGSKLVLENPWPRTKVKVTDSSMSELNLTGDVLYISTNAGSTYSFERS